MSDLAPPLTLDDKDQWRRWATLARRERDPASVSRQVTEGLATWLPSAREGKVVLYLPLPNEVDITGLMDRRDRCFVLTRTPQTGALTLHPASADRELHKYGFEQPDANASRVDRSEVGVVLVPGLVFDRTGQRLGRGAGYYDTFLPTVPADAERVAIVPSWMIVDAIPTESHDVAMTHLATERGVQRIR